MRTTAAGTMTVEIMNRTAAVFAFVAVAIVLFPLFASGHKLKRGPDFIIAGTQKGGSSDLTKDILMKHPEILMPKKEVHYFEKCGTVTNSWGACGVARLNQPSDKKYFDQGGNATMNVTLRSELLDYVQTPEGSNSKNCTLEAYLDRWVSHGNQGKEPDTVTDDLIVGEKTPKYMYYAEVRRESATLCFWNRPPNKWHACSIYLPCTPPVRLPFFHSQDDASCSLIYIFFFF